MIDKLFILVLLLATTFSCRKLEQPENARATKFGGCNDIDSPLYDATIDYDNQSCRYAFIERYEISYHPEKDGSSNWDPTFFTDADLELRIKVQGSADFLFESSTKEDQAHDVPAIWAAPESIKLLNQKYEWELYDSDIGTADDFVAGGTFNPIGKADAGEIVIKDNSGGTQLKIYYELKEEI